MKAKIKNSVVILPVVIAAIAFLLALTSGGFTDTSAAEKKDASVEYKEAEESYKTLSLMADVAAESTENAVLVVDYKTATAGLFQKNEDGQYFLSMFSKISYGRDENHYTAPGTYHVHCTQRTFTVQNEAINGRFWYASWLRNDENGSDSNAIHSTAYRIEDEDYPKEETDGRLGERISNGCIRVPLYFAESFYNLGTGSRVVIFSDIEKGY